MLTRTVFSSVPCRVMRTNDLYDLMLEEVKSQDSLKDYVKAVSTGALLSSDQDTGDESSKVRQRTQL